MPGVYVHFPYCLQICPYCDFAVRKERVIPQRRFTDAIVAELRMRAGGFAPLASGAGAGAGREVVSIYFGGGTPSLWEPGEVARVLAEVRALLPVIGAPEVTLEANPEAAEIERLRAYRDAGVTRISLGVQSFDAGQLRALGRCHTPEQAERSIADALAAGFEAVSVDLIHGGQGETAAIAAADATRAAALGAQHVSCYALTLTALAVEVPMARLVRRGKLKLPGDEEQAAMGEALRSALAEAGLRRYEISNFARPGFESIHNGLYWRGAEYLAVGPGAAGFRLERGPSLRGVRTTNERSVNRWMASVLEGRLAEALHEELAAADMVRERIFTGLRLVEGVDLAEVESWSGGLDVRGEHGPAIDRLVREGLATFDGRGLALTERGLDLHSEAALRFF